MLALELNEDWSEDEALSRRIDEFSSSKEKIKMLFINTNPIIKLVKLIVYRNWNYYEFVMDSEAYCDECV